MRRQWSPCPEPARDVRFDGGDRILCSGGPLTVVHYQRPNTQLIAGSCETLSRQAVAGAYAYSVPVGTNTYTRYGGNGTAGSPFKYVYLDLVAFEDDTHVFIDNKGGGTASFHPHERPALRFTRLDRPDRAPAVTILEGTKVSTDKPITGLIFTGGSNQWQTRFYALLPDLLHGTDFVTTAPGNVTGGHQLNLYVYNPNPSAAISVTCTDSSGTATISVRPNSVRAYTEATPNGMGRVVPANSTVRLTSSSTFLGHQRLRLHAEHHRMGPLLAGHEVPEQRLLRLLVAGDPAIPSGPTRRAGPAVATASPPATPSTAPPSGFRPSRTTPGSRSTSTTTGSTTRSTPTPTTSRRRRPSRTTPTPQRGPVPAGIRLDRLRQHRHPGRRQQAGLRSIGQDGDQGQASDPTLDLGTPCSPSSRSGSTRS